MQYRDAGAVWSSRSFQQYQVPRDMGSYERSGSDNAGVVNDRGVDWSRYGLGNTENRRPSRLENRGHEELGPEMYQTGTNELFAQEFVSVSVRIV